MKDRGPIATISNTLPEGSRATPLHRGRLTHVWQTRVGFAVATLGLLVIFAVGADRVGAQEALTDAQRAFVARYVAALRSKDVGRDKALLHPKTLACVGPATAEFFDDLFARQMRYRVADGYRASVQPIPAGQPLLFEGDFQYPVRPTHWIQVDLDPDAASSTSVMLQVVAERGTWYEVIGCPTPATMQKIRAAAAQRTQDTERARALATALADPLRARLLGLLREGRRITAIQEYQAATGEDLAMARRVIELLEATRPR